MVSFTLTLKSLDLKKEYKMMEFLAEMARKKKMYSKYRPRSCSRKKDCVFHVNFFLQPWWITGNFVPLMFLQGPFFSAEGDLGLHTRKNPGENTGNGICFQVKKNRDKAIFSTVQYWHPCWGAYTRGGGGVYNRM